MHLSKIATGHNLDDEAQTILINLFKASLNLSSSSGPITANISDKKFIARIKPLFYVPENDIRKYSKKKKLLVIYEKCPCAIDSYRVDVRSFLEKRPSKEKENLMKNARDILKNINVKGRINYCKICEEPSRKEICKKCMLMEA